MPETLLQLCPEEVRLKLFRLKEIPPPSGSAQVIMRVAADENVSLTQIVSLIEKSSELTARILRCANSAYYGQRSQICSVREAVIRVLGLSVTKSLILAMALAGSFRLRPCAGFDKERHWFVSVTTATLAQDLSRKLLVYDKPAPGTAYTAGLIHNLGVLALLHSFPNQMEQVFAQDNSSNLQQAMMNLIGVDHRIAGGWLAQRWGLPEDLILTITHHEDPTYTGSAWPLVRLIGLSALFAVNLYQGTINQNTFTRYTQSDMIDNNDVEQSVLRLIEQADKLKGLAQLLAGDGGRS